MVASSGFDDDSGDRRDRRAMTAHEGRAVAVTPARCAAQRRLRDGLMTYDQILRKAAIRTQ